ncbi:MAG TPA: hypothetical protein VJ385_06715 [Fibrobacteria bacterium]|nr:hypothetical protein [Fibrobacteria bacterium]
MPTITYTNRKGCIYENVGPDPGEFKAFLVQRPGFGLGSRNPWEIEDKHARFMPVPRFILMDDRRRIFFSQRMCFRSSIDDWILVGSPKPVVKSAGELVPTLGTDAFYELS